MPSTYTTNGGIEKIASGEQSGTWGTTTNTNFDILDRITNGVGTIDLSGSAAAHTLQTQNGTLSDGMFRVLVLDGATEACTITIDPNDAQKLYYVDNSSGFDCTFTQGSGGNVTIANGTMGIIFCDGGGATAAVTAVSSNLTGLLTAANNLSDVADAGTARTNLGLAIGTDVQAYDAQLTDLAGLAVTDGNFIVGDGTNWVAESGDTAIASLGVTATAVELNYNDIATLGLSEASKVVTADANGVVTFDDGVSEASSSLTSASGEATLDLQTSTNFTHTLSEDVTYTFSNPASSGYVSVFSLKVTQDSTARTITWPTSVDWADSTAPTLSTTSGAVDIFVFITYDGGTNYYGFTAGQAMG